MNMLLYQNLAFSIHKKIWKNHTWKKKTKFKISDATWNEEFELTDGLYSVSKQKKHEAVAENPLIKIYVNKTENKIMIKIETGYFLELLSPETIKLLGSTKIKITNDKNG